MCKYSKCWVLMFQLVLLRKIEPGTTIGLGTHSILLLFATRTSKKWRRVYTTIQSVHVVVDHQLKFNATVHHLQTVVKTGSVFRVNGNQQEARLKPCYLQTFITCMLYPGNKASEPLVSQMMLFCVAHSGSPTMFYIYTNNLLATFVPALFLHTFLHLKM